MESFEALSEARNLRPATVRQMRGLLARPEEVVYQLLDVLQAFAGGGFQQCWTDQRAALSGLAATLQAQLDVDLPRAIATISPRAVCDPREDRLALVGGSDLHVLGCEHCGEIALLPSRWLRRRVAVALAPGRAGVAMGCGPALRTELAYAEMPAMMSALGDERRFEILRLCIQRPRTTSELAPTLGITAGPVSRHLKELERGGLVIGERYGREVRYSAVVEMLHLLGLRLQNLTRHVWAERRPTAVREPKAA